MNTRRKLLVAMAGAGSLAALALGGRIAATGPDGLVAARRRSWALGANVEIVAAGIQDPRHEDAFVSIATLDGRCLATSGDYVTAFSADFSCHHIFRSGHRSLAAGVQQRQRRRVQWAGRRCAVDRGIRARVAGRPAAD